MWGKKRELEGRREMQEKGILFVILPLFFVVRGWIHSPLKNWEYDLVPFSVFKWPYGRQWVWTVTISGKNCGWWWMPEGRDPSQMGFSTWEKELELIYHLHWLFKNLTGTVALIWSPVLCLKQGRQKKCLFSCLLAVGISSLDELVCNPTVQNASFLQ